MKKIFKLKELIQHIFLKYEESLGLGVLKTQMNHKSICSREHDLIAG